MSKICPNCNKTYEEGKFCLICGTPLVENAASKPSAGSSLNLGDANAISGGVNVSDNHSINQNTVNTTTHNVDSHNVINNHITQVAKEKTSEEIRQESMKIYRKACQDVFQDGVQTSEEKRRLDELQFQLGIDEETAAHIVESVRSTSARKSAVLGPVQQITFNNIKTAILNNRTDMINRLLPQLKAMVQKFSSEELQYTYYMLQAIMAPESCVKDYERPHEDKYWQTFWSSVAYRRIGDIEHSEMLVVDVGDKWIDTIPQENVYVLATVNALIDGDMTIAKSLYDQITGEHSNLLSVLVGCLYPLIYHDIPITDDIKKMTLTGKFYTENLFKAISDNVEEQKQALAEAKRKAEEELARQKEEEEQKAVDVESILAKYRDEKGELRELDPNEYTQAFEDFQLCADRGNLEAMCNLAWYYECGTGTRRDEKKAFEWYMKAADRGSAKGVYMVGHCYEYGTGTRKDEKKAFEWYMKAAEVGDADGMYKVGQCYKYGCGTDEDEMEAYEWYGKAAEAGDTQALKVLKKEAAENNAKAQDVLEEIGEDWSEDDAVEWYLDSYQIIGSSFELKYVKKAAAEGNKKAQDALTEIGEKWTKDDAFEWYEERLQISDDPFALEWIKNAAAEGNKEAQKQLEIYNLINALRLGEEDDFDSVSDELDAITEEYEQEEEIDPREAEKEWLRQLRHWPKFCNKCGNPLTPGQKFCNKCGNQIIINS